MLEDMLREFVARGGVITLYASKDPDKPVRFAIKFEGETYSGKTANLESILSGLMADHEDQQRERDEVW